MVGAACAALLASAGACFDWSSLSSACGTPLVAAYVVPGHTHTCARTTDGKLYCWGDNRQGELGTGDAVSRDAPTRVPMPGGARVSRVYLPVGDGDQTSVQGAFTCAQTSDAALYCWGDNTSGQVGLGDVGAGAPSTTTPTAVTLPSPVENACAGAQHTCAQTTDGSLYCWGSNTYGQLGTGDTSAQPSPAQVPAASFGMGLANSSLFCGAYHTCAQTIDGTLYCWGSNTSGQLGLGDAGGAMSASPTPVPFAAGDPVIHGGAAGAGFTCVERGDQSVVCWGDNAHGQLGTGDQLGRASADLSMPALTNTLSVYAGETFACATQADETVWCWGDNRAGELGLGDTQLHLTPTQVSPAALGATAHGVSAMSAGGAHVCAIASGALTCWGDNTYGELGVPAASAMLATSPEPVSPVGCP